MVLNALFISWKSTWICNWLLRVCFMFKCIATRALAIATNRGAIVHSLFAMSLMRGSYFVCLFEILSGGNLS